MSPRPPTGDLGRADPGRADPGRAGVGRRSFLAGAAAAGVAGLGAGFGAARATAAPPPAVVDPDALGRAVVPFHGPHQAGVTTPAPAHAALVALDLRPGAGREQLVRLMRIWTDDAERLTSGRPGLTDTEPELATAPSSLTVTVGLGPGAFEASGLAALRPTWLTPLPPFAIDALEDRWSGGDLLLQVCAEDPLAVAHPLRVMLKEARAYTRVRWVQRGFRNAVGALPPGTTMRNLFGQVDGTSNPAGAELDDLVWHGQGAPGWLVGGTSVVVRRIAMDLDRWDEVDRPGRDSAVGRRMSDGSPLTGSEEHDDPDLDAVDDLGLPVINEVSHVHRSRSTNPREKFLRRAWNYDEAPAPGVLSDSGLVFVSFQADVLEQFLPVQQRLAEADLLNEWTTPVGSAVFAVPGGCGPGEYLAQRLLEP